MNLTETELRELDAWIADNVMVDWKPPIIPRDMSGNPFPGWDAVPRFSRDDSPAFRILGKCVSDSEIYGVTITKETWGFELKVGSRIIASAETLPLAICLLAKKLFTK